MPLDLTEAQQCLLEHLVSREIDSVAIRLSRAREAIQYRELMFGEEVPAKKYVEQLVQRAGDLDAIAQELGIEWGRATVPETWLARACNVVTVNKDNPA